MQLPPAATSTIVRSISCCPDDGRPGGDYRNLIGRTLWNINLELFNYSFACTWVAVHPNIQGPDEKWVAVAARRVRITLMAVIAPELVIVWQ